MSDSMNALRRKVYAFWVLVGLGWSLIGCGAVVETSGSEKCRSVAKGQNYLLQKIIRNDLRSQPSVKLSIDALNGCDSANNGAWLNVRIDDKGGDMDIQNLLLGAGWTLKPEAIHKCGRDCGTWSMAKADKGRVIGVRISDDRPSGSTSWHLEVSFADDCWTSRGFFC